MKVFAVLGMMLLSGNLWAQALFTTVAYRDTEVLYVGLKGSHASNPQSQIVLLQTKDNSKQNIKLPEEIAARDVIGIIPEKNKLFILSLRQSDLTDKPLLHVHDLENSSWKKIGDANCHSFIAARIRSSDISFRCETGKKTRRGKAIFQWKSLPLGKERIFSASGIVRFPEFLLRYGKQTISLEGLAPDWTRLRIKSDTKEQLFQAEELFEKSSG